MGLIFEAFRIFFFGSGAVRLSERLGLAHNAGYTAEGDAAAGGNTIFLFRPLAQYYYLCYTIKVALRQMFLIHKYSMKILMLFPVSSPFSILKFMTLNVVKKKNVFHYRLKNHLKTEKKTNLVFNRL